MTSLYPSAIDSYAQIAVLVDRRDEIVCKDHNDLRSAVLALEQTLGLNPQGIFGTVVARLNSYGSAIDTTNGNFAQHVAGTGFRHTDTHIDAIAKAGIFNNLGVGTTRTQTQDLLDFFDYPGSGATVFADGLGVAAQSLITTPTNIVAQLGSADGYEKIGTQIVTGTPHSLPGGAVSDHTSALLDVLNDIATSVPSGGLLVGIDDTGFSALSGATAQEALDSADAQMNTLNGHTSVFVSCSDGVLSTGGQFNGTDAIDLALDSYGAAGNNGATILIRRGNYTINSSKLIQSRVNLIGVEESIIITNAVGADFMLYFDTDSYGSSVENIGIIQDPVFGSGLNIRIESDQVSIKKLSADGNIRLNGYRTKIEQCDLYLEEPIAPSILDAYGSSWASEISDTRFVVLNGAFPGATAVQYNGSNTLFDNCVFLTADGYSGFVDFTTSRWLTLRKCRFESQPYTPGTAIMDLIGYNPILDGVFIGLGGSGDIDALIVSIITGTFRAKNISIDMGTNRLAYMNTLGNSPIIFSSHDGIVDGISIKGGIIPTVGTDGFSLDPDFPLVQVSGYGLVDDAYGVMRVMNGRIKAPGEATPLGGMNFSLIGSENTGGDPVVTDGSFELYNISIDGYETTTYVTGVDQKVIITGVQPSSRIIDCNISDGYWGTAIFMQNCKGSKVESCNITFDIVGAIESAIIVTATNFCAADEVFIKNNTIRFTDLNGGGLLSPVILIGLVPLQYCVVNNNAILNMGPTGYPSIYFLTATTYNNIAIGNILKSGAAGPPAGFYIADAAAAGPVYFNRYESGAFPPVPTFDLNNFMP